MHPLDSSCRKFHAEAVPLWHAGTLWGQLQTMSLDAVYAAETRSLTGTMCQLGQVVQQAAAAFQRLSQQVWLWY